MGDFRDANPEKRWVGRSFGAAAATYDRFAELQRSVATRLLAKLERMPSPTAILDVGAGTGWPTARLRERFPAAELYALDLSEAMLRVLRGRPEIAAGCGLVCGDAERVPFRDGMFDLIFSNLAIQWCASPAKVFGEFRRMLRPGGRLVFSTLAEGTLEELRLAWAAVDDYSHVNAFAKPSVLAAALEAAGFDPRQLESESRRFHYRDVQALMQELKGLGAHNVTRDRPRHLLGKSVFQLLNSSYSPKLENGQIIASFEVIYGISVLAGQNPPEIPEPAVTASIEA